jgi:hypothetical protein
MKEFFPKHKANMEISARPAPTALDSLVTNRIDKSQLALAEPRRLREKAHLKFVASQPCLICGEFGSFGFPLTQTLAACHISSGRQVVW